MFFLFLESFLKFLTGVIIIMGYFTIELKYTLGLENMIKEIINHSESGVSYIIAEKIAIFCIYNSHVNVTSK